MICTNIGILEAHLELLLNILHDLRVALKHTLEIFLGPLPQILHVVVIFLTIFLAIFVLK